MLKIDEAQASVRQQPWLFKMHILIPLSDQFSKSEARGDERNVAANIL